MIDNYWTTHKPINGLRHFVLVNETKIEGDIIFLMVSVIDSDINLEISNQELMNSEIWVKGWLDLPKCESITEDYIKYKSLQREEEVNKNFISHDSIFNIS